MAKRRLPKPYKDGPRKQMTVAWKRLVLDKLAKNKRDSIKPANLSQLSVAIEADKRGVYEMFDLERDPPQMASTYVDDICATLGIGQPMSEASHDDELEQDLAMVRAMSPAQRKAMLAFVRDFKR